MMSSTLPSYLPIGKQLNTGQIMQTPPPEEIEGEEEYEVTEILSHWGSPGRCSYLISWKGYSPAENTWEPEWNLQHTQTILKEYKQWRNL